MRQKLSSQQGFTLIEVLIALTIMTGTLVVLNMAWSTSFLRMTKMKLNNQAAYLLDYKVAEIQREYRDRFSLIPDADSGDFSDLGSEYRRFSWGFKAKEFVMPNLTPLLMSQAGAEGANSLLIMMMDQLTEFFSDAAKEVTVTVTYKYGKKSIRYSASMLLIDFNKTLPLPSAGDGGLGQ